MLYPTLTQGAPRYQKGTLSKAYYWYVSFSFLRRLFHQRRVILTIINGTPVCHVLYVCVNILMAAEAAGKRAFDVLRPLCVQVMKAPTVEATRALDTALVSLPSLHPALVEYVTLPLRLVLRQGPRRVFNGDHVPHLRWLRNQQVFAGLD